MIEAVMLVTLGFLTATLLWLSVLPALTRRADRLARRRAEAAFPLSLAEIAADRDHLRAELAVRERALEQRAESGFSARAGAMGEVGRRDMTIAGLERDLAERNARIAELEQDLDGTRDDLAKTRDELAAESAAHRGVQERLAERVADLAALEQRLADTRGELGGTSSELAARSHELGALREAHERVEAALAERERSLAALRIEKDAQHVALVEANTARLTLETRGEDLATRLAANETALTETRKDLAAMTVDRDSERLRADAVTGRAMQAEAARHAADANAIELGAEIVRREDVEKQMGSALAAEQAKVAELEARLSDLGGRLEVLQRRKDEDDRALHESQRRHQETIEALHAEMLTMQGARDQARADRGELKSEIATLRSEIAKGAAGGAAEQAALRQEIVKLADMLMAAGDERAAAE